MFRRLCQIKWHSHRATVHKLIAVKSASGQTTVGIDPQVKQMFLCFQLLNLFYTLFFLLIEYGVMSFAPYNEGHASFWWHGHFSRMRKGIAVKSVSGQTTVGIDPQVLCGISLRSQLLNLSHNSIFVNRVFLEMCCYVWHEVCSYMLSDIFCQLGM